MPRTKKGRGTPPPPGPQSSSSEIVAKLNKGYKTELLRVGSASLLSDISGVIPTGWTTLDYLIRGGFPLGRIVELYGPEGTGKSSLAYAAAARAQQHGGKAVVYDAEGTIDKPLLAAMGVDVGGLIVVDRDIHLDGKGSMFETTREVVSDLRAHLGEGPPILVVWDTLAASPTLAASKGEESKAEGPFRAIKIREGLRRLTHPLLSAAACLCAVNHIHEQVGGSGASWSGPRTSSHGGRGMKYHSTLRLALRAASHVTDSDNNRVGREIVAKIEKSKVMPPMKEARTRLYYGVGFSDEWSLFDLLTVSGVIERRGAWYSVTFNDEEIKFQTSGYVQLVSETEGLLRHLQAEAVRILSGDKS